MSIGKQKMDDVNSKLHGLVEHLNTVSTTWQRTNMDGWGRESNAGELSAATNDMEKASRELAFYVRVLWNDGYRLCRNDA